MKYASPCCRDHVRKSDVSPGLHCRLVRLDCRLLTYDNTLNCSISTSAADTCRCCLVQAIVQSVCGMYQTETPCKRGWTSSWTWTAPTKCLRCVFLMSLACFMRLLPLHMHELLAALRCMRNLRMEFLSSCSGQELQIRCVIHVPCCHSFHNHTIA